MKICKFYLIDFIILYALILFCPYKMKSHCTRTQYLVPLGIYYRIICLIEKESNPYFFI